MAMRLQKKLTSAPAQKRGPDYEAKYNAIVRELQQIAGMGGISGTAAKRVLDAAGEDSNG